MKPKIYHEKFKKEIVLFLFVFVLFYTLIPLVTKAATLYLIPQSQTIYQGNTFIVEVRLDTEGEEINAVKADLEFSPDLLKASDFSKGGSILNLWAKEPVFSNEEGFISFAGGLPGGFRGKELALKITFLAKETGQVNVSFKEDSQVLLNDGKGTPALLVFLEGNYEIVKKPEGLPIISSRTNPDQNKWYNRNTLHLHWDLVEGVQYSYILSKDPLTEPDDIPDKPEGELVWVGDMEYPNLEDGIYYFSLRQKLPGKDWSERVGFRVMIDVISPKEFTLEIGQDPSMFGGKYFLSFTTTDKTSGIDYYEAKEGKQDFKKVSSPYLLEDQFLGKKIVVRAYDKTGNYQTAEIKPPYKITWKDVVILLLILIGILVGWRLIRKFK